MFTSSDQNDDLKVTADNVKAFNFEEILSRSPRPTLKNLKGHTCFNYEYQFTTEAQHTQDPVRKTICEIFAIICSFQLNVD